MKNMKRIMMFWNMMPVKDKKALRLGLISPLDGILFRAEMPLILLRIGTENNLQKKVADCKY